ncbi:MAG: FAD binding domain-containing protein [bacterium]
MKLALTINNEHVEIDTDPRNLLLNVLRDKLGLMGTKCGCGEGECGACTVVLNGRTVNSCLTVVGQAHGGYITTIEGLAASEGGKSLLTVFADKGAVQCGFCTPGIAMSASTLADQKTALSEDDIRQGLSGHLCRCTGYVKIIDAVKASTEGRLNLPQLREKGFLPITDAQSSCFLRPDNLAHALEALADMKKGWKVLAGGSDLVVKNENRTHTLNLLDISGIPDLKGITRKDGEIRIGAGTPFSELIHSPLIAEQFPTLVAAARQIGGVQIQNTGTIGGNIASGSPAADIVPPLMTMGAVLELVSRKGTVTIALDDFFSGLNRTVLAPDQLIRQIILPLPSVTGETIAFFDKLGVRKALSITKASVAMYGKRVNNRLTSVKIALGSVAENVIPAPKAADILMGGELTHARLNQAADMLSTEARPIDDMFSTEAYCRLAVRGLLIRNLWQFVKP